jgi:hypothetical protein
MAEKGANDFEWIHPVSPDQGSTISTQSEDRAAARTEAPAGAIPMISAEGEGPLRMVVAELILNRSRASGPARSGETVSTD